MLQKPGKSGFVDYNSCDRKLCSGSGVIRSDFQSRDPVEKLMSLQYIRHLAFGVHYRNHT